MTEPAESNKHSFGESSAWQPSSGRSDQNRLYPRPRSKRVAAYESRMQAVDPDYRMPLVDFWDPVLAKQLENVRREGHGWVCGDFGNLILRYRKSRLKEIRVDLEVLDRSTGRRLRQDGSDSELLLSRLGELIPGS